MNRNASTKLTAQAKALALSDEGTAFVAESNGVEAFRHNQRVFHLPVKYQPGGVAATGRVVAVGGDVSQLSLPLSSPSLPLSSLPPSLSP